MNNRNVNRILWVSSILLAASALFCARADAERSQIRARLAQQLNRPQSTGAMTPGQVHIGTVDGRLVRVVLNAVRSKQSPAKIAQGMAPSLSGASLIIKTTDQGATTARAFSTAGGVATPLSTTTSWKNGLDRHAQGGKVAWTRTRTAGRLEVSSTKVQGRDGEGRFTRAQQPPAGQKYQQAVNALGLIGEALPAR